MGPTPSPAFPAGPPNVTRTDPTIDFNWGTTTSPVPGTIALDGYVARWTGSFEPRFDGEYEFYTESDDGCRLWVDGQLIIGSWIDQGPTWRVGRTGNLQRGWRYSIVMEYYENGGGAVARLSWASTCQPLGIIPQTQLFTFTTPIGGLPGPNAGSGTPGPPGPDIRDNPNGDSSGNDKCIGGAAGAWADRSRWGWLCLWAALGLLSLRRR